jgi:DNA-3-methyladenine glycosylase II
MKFKIKTPGEFSYDFSLEYLTRSAKEPMHIVHERVVKKLVRIGDELILFNVSFKNDHLLVEILSKDQPDHIVQKIKEYVHEWFDLSTDLTPFYSLAKKDDVLKSIVKKFHGYRIMGQPDLFESLIWAVLGQQINLAFAYSIKQRFVEKYGEKLEHDGNTYWLFPTPEVVSKLTHEELLPLQFSRQKSNYTIGIAQAFVDKKLSREMFHGKSLLEAKEELMKIKGIGNWTANYAIMRTFRYPDAFPLEDVALHKALFIQMNMRARPSLDRVKKIFKKYKGWEAYATLYLWKSL